MDEPFIRPYRIIPFDIGGNISKEECKIIFDKYNTLNNDCKIQVHLIDSFQKSLSIRLICSYKITENILLFIYSFGVGVFVVQDDDFIVENMQSKYAADYCKCRRKAHKNILNFQASYSTTIRTVIDFIHSEYSTWYKEIRLSASSQWKMDGFAYVMTVSYINTNASGSCYTTMSDMEKHNLQIMLTPSLAHEEDSEIIKLLNLEKRCDPYTIDLGTLKEPDNFWKGTNADIYISWAAVIVMQDKIQTGYIEFINSLEVDLQAMWFYTYCMYYSLRNDFEIKRMFASKLKRIENKFERQYNEFLNNSDSSHPQYVSDVRNELIRTSEIQEEHDKLIEYINYCIDEIETIEREHQRKYAWLNESLLFIIAYADIVTTLATSFVNDFSCFGQIAFVLFAVVIFILGILFIIKKG